MCTEQCTLCGVMYNICVVVPQSAVVVLLNAQYTVCHMLNTILTCLQVNGKSYPIAKLQLGHMGALHPANRLAAYITGRLDPVNLPGYPKSQDQATTMASSTVATPGGDVNTSVTKATATPLPPKATGEVSLVVVFMVADRGSGKYYFGEM